MNPEPLAPFFDAIVIGEVEELLPALIELLQEGLVGTSAPGRGRQQLAAFARPAGRLCPALLEPRPAGRAVQRSAWLDMARLSRRQPVLTDTEFANPSPDRD